MPAQSTLAMSLLTCQIAPASAATSVHRSWAVKRAARPIPVASIVMPCQSTLATAITPRHVRPATADAPTTAARRSDRMPRQSWATVHASPYQRPFATAVMPAQSTFATVVTPRQNALATAVMTDQMQPRRARRDGPARLSGDRQPRP